MVDKTKGGWSSARAFAALVGAEEAKNLRAQVDAELIRYDLEPTTESDWDRVTYMAIDPNTRAYLKQALDSAAKRPEEMRPLLQTLVKGQNADKVLMDIQLAEFGLPPSSDLEYRAVQQMMKDPKMRAIAAKVSVNLQDPDRRARIKAHFRRSMH